MSSSSWRMTAAVFCISMLRKTQPPIGLLDRSWKRFRTTLRLNTWYEIVTTLVITIDRGRICHWIRMLQNPVQCRIYRLGGSFKFRKWADCIIGTSALLLDTNEFRDLHKIEYWRRTGGLGAHQRRLRRRHETQRQHRFDPLVR